MPKQPRPAPVRLELVPGASLPVTAPTAATWVANGSCDRAELQPNQKILHFVRHAEGYHNVDKRPIHERPLDARLTPNGEAQCASLARITAELRPQLVVSSPLTRTLQTARLVFGSPEREAANAPILALESVRETVNYGCDARRPLREIRPEFPGVDFSNCPADDDPLWSQYAATYGDYKFERTEISD